MGAARASVHRRCCPCDVAGRRSRNQSRDPGCGCDGEYPGPRDAQARAEIVGPEENPAPPRVAYESNPVVSGAGAEPRAGPKLPRPPDTEAAAGTTSREPFPISATYTG